MKFPFPYTTKPKLFEIVTHMKGDELGTPIFHCRAGIGTGSTSYLHSENRAKFGKHLTS